MDITRLPDISGDAASSLREIKSYIIRLDRQLSLLLDNVGSENLAPELKDKIYVQTDTELGALKNEIIETATEIKAISDRIDLRLESDYVAKSELGTYTEQAFQDIRIDGKGVTQFFEEITSLSQRMDGVEGEALQAANGINVLGNVLDKINAYIRTGKLSDGVYGVEIGNTSGASCPYKVRLSENRLSFFVNDEEVAYFSDNFMYISRANIPYSLNVGQCVIRQDNGLTFSCD
jgi:hypothetical protein